MRSIDTDTRGSDDGYRRNVGIILLNRSNQVFWARRSQHDGWQFPQGGVQHDETPEQALYRELYEEVGLTRCQVKIVARTNGWLRYDLPGRYRRRSRSGKTLRGQKQIWFLLTLLGDESAVCLDVSERPEFDEWMWIDYWSAVDNIIEFKRSVYETALSELEHYLPKSPFFGRL